MRLICGVKVPPVPSKPERQGLRLLRYRLGCVADDEDWSPDEVEGTETYSSWDEALDEEDELVPDELDNPEGERSLDRQLVTDDAELEELGAQLDDPEQLATLAGGMDDPDGAGGGSRVRDDEEGWELDEAEERTGALLDEESRSRKRKGSEP